MVVDNLSSIAHAAVADLNSVAVKHFPQFVACWEMLFYQGKEAVSNIFGDIFVIVLQYEVNQAIHETA